MASEPRAALADAQVQQLDDFFEAVPAFLTGQFAHVRDKVEERLRRHLRIQGCPFGQIADVALRDQGFRLDIVPADSGAAGTGCNESCDHLHGR